MGKQIVSPKVAKEIETLNSNFATINRLNTNYITVTSLDDMKAKLIAASNTAAQNNTVIEIGIAVSYSSVEMPGWQSYYGQLNVAVRGSQFNGTFTSENGNVLTVSLNNNTWTIYAPSKPSKNFKFYYVNANSSFDITVSNPCFVFAGESDSDYLIAHCYSNGIHVIAGALSSNSITKQSTYVLRVTNNRAWNMPVWVMTWE